MNNINKVNINALSRIIYVLENKHAMNPNKKMFYLPRNFNNLSLNSNVNNSKNTFENTLNMYAYELQFYQIFTNSYELR